MARRRTETAEMKFGGNWRERGGGVMDEDFCREQVERIRTLAERADPFTRRRLLALVGRYEAKVGGPPRTSKTSERPLPVRTTPPASIFSGSGEA